MGFGDAVITVASAGPRANNLHLGVCCAECLLVASCRNGSADRHAVWRTWAKTATTTVVSNVSGLTYKETQIHSVP